MVEHLKVMLNNKFILKSILSFSVVSLAIAYYIQYILGHKPCNLCLIERIPYFSAVILVSLMFVINKYKRVIAGILMLFFILSFLTKLPKNLLLSPLKIQFLK